MAARYIDPEQNESGNGQVSLQGLEAEIRRLKRENAILHEEHEILKSHEAVLAGARMKYQFIATHVGEHAVARICRVLGVSNTARTDKLTDGFSEAARL